MKIWTILVVALIISTIFVDDIDAQKDRKWKKGKKNKGKWKGKWKGKGKGKGNGKDTQPPTTTGQNALAYVINDEIAEGACFDNSDLMDDLLRFRGECNTGASSRHEIPDWRSKCSTVQMLMGACNRRESEESRMTPCLGTDGVACQFPFTYGGREFPACTTFANPTPWCKTVAGQFRNCETGNPSCANGNQPDSGSGGNGGGSASATVDPISGLPIPVQKEGQQGMCVTTYPTLNGENELVCVFPFPHNNVLYDGCTTDGPIQWCSYINDTSGTHWAFCNDNCFIVDAQNKMVQAGLGMPIALSECVLRKFGWVTGDGAESTFSVDAFQTTITEKIGQEGVRTKLIEQVEDCKSMNSTSLPTVTGGIAGIANVRVLACLQQHFEESCMDYASTLVKNMANPSTTV